MDTPAPLATKSCYAVAAMILLLGILGFVFYVRGADLGTSPSSTYARAFQGLIVLQGAFVFLGALVPAVFFAAFGAAIHDLRRIAVNTAPESLSAVLTSGLARAQPVSLVTAPAGSKIEYYYFENGVEHGPVTRARIRDLMQAKRLTSFQKFEKSVNGVRETCDAREFDRST